MTNRFAIADLHFYHKGILKFTREDGSPLRNFTDIEAMNEYIINNWNKTVSPEDTVYVLGDVSMNIAGIAVIGRCNGTKILIKGNHDRFALKEYTPYFEDIKAYKIFSKEGIIMSHIPIHPQSMSRWKLNVHGHTHADSVKLSHVHDISYFCVSCEQIGYTPVPFEFLAEVAERNV